VFFLVYLEKKMMEGAYKRVERERERGSEGKEGW
jgi:hypothetical protein